MHVKIIEVKLQNLNEGTETVYILVFLKLRVSSTAPLIRVLYLLTTDIMMTHVHHEKQHCVRNKRLRDYPKMHKALNIQKEAFPECWAHPALCSVITQNLNIRILRLNIKYPLTFSFGEDHANYRF